MNANSLTKITEARFKVTRKAIAAIPSDKLGFKPTPEMMTARELGLHLIGNYTFLRDGLANNNWSPDAFKISGDFETTNALLSRLDAVFSDLKQRTGLLKEEAFEQRVNPFGTEQKVSSLIQGIAEHEIHHRGQLYVYLRLMGLTPPAMYE